MKYEKFTHVMRLALRKYQADNKYSKAQMAEVLGLSERQIKSLRTSCAAGISKPALQKFEILLQEAGW